MTNTKEQSVVWKQYPDYPFIEANQYGEVRTVDRDVTYRNGRKHHYKGRVLKQKLNPNGYMYVTFSVNGKAIHLRVHRIVATCFIPNPNGYLEVNHIDNNRTNNNANNLEWCTRQYNQDYKKNFGTSQAQLFGRPLFAVNLKTGKVLRFESQAEAERELGINHENINRVIKGDRIQAGDYWFTEDKSEITEEKIQEIKNNMRFYGGVLAVNLETKKVLYFESQTEAAYQLQVDKRNLSNVLKGRRNKTGGCWFCYANENAIEKTREKFDDEVTSQVKKLMSDNCD